MLPKFSKKKRCLIGRHKKTPVLLELCEPASFSSVCQTGKHNYRPKKDHPWRNRGTASYQKMIQSRKQEAQGHIRLKFDGCVYSPQFSGEAGGMFSRKRV